MYGPTPARSGRPRRAPAAPRPRARGSPGSRSRRSPCTPRSSAAASAGAGSRTSSWTRWRPRRRWARPRWGPGRSLLGKSPRHRAVLDLAAQKADWGTPLPPGRARGIAVAFSYGSYAAHVAEVSVAPDGKPRVHKIVGAIDCGIAVNPDQVRAQMEGGAMYALTAALYGEITIDRGRVKQSNFHDYPMLRLNESPVIEVHILA